MTGDQLKTTLNHQVLALIEEHIHHLLKMMDFTNSQVNCVPTNTKDRQGASQLHLRIDITTAHDGRMLIGPHGSHLQALQHIIRSLIRRQWQNTPYLTVDINGYLASRERALFNVAEEAARKAGSTGRAIVLPPMDAAGRRTIHTSLATRPDIHTESLGDEPNRRVVIRPIFI